MIQSAADNAATRSTAEVSPDSIDHDAKERKLSIVEGQLRPFVRTPSVVQVRHPTQVDRYRSSCTFQWILVTDEEGHYYAYAQRSHGKVVPLQQQDERVVNDRIRIVMQQLREEVLLGAPSSLGNGSFGALLADQVASITFRSAWCGTIIKGLTTAVSSESSETADCVITLHYHPTAVAAISQDGDDESSMLFRQTWSRQARWAAQLLGVQQIRGRIKGQPILRAFCSPHSRQQLTKEVDDGIVSEAVCAIGNDHVDYVRDVLYYQRSGGMAVSLTPPTGGDWGSVRYRHQCVDAFAHPNPVVMIQALEWMRTRLALIVATAPKQEKFRVCELYAGGGAHSIILATALAAMPTITTLEWTVVEQDDRLVRACRNHVLDNAGMEHVIRVEAAQDAARYCRRRLKQMHAETESSRCDGRMASVLVVDPPKQGLCTSVRRFAALFNHVLYISCGPDALKRDLAELTSGVGLQVVDCQVHDLFPSTYAVETLVHLHRQG